MNISEGNEKEKHHLVFYRSDALMQENAPSICQDRYCCCRESS